MTDPLTIPDKAGRAIVETAAMRACPLLGTDRFVRFCSDRGLAIDRERLIRLERLGLFAPVFRVRTPKKPAAQFRIPPSKDNNWFTKRWAHDTTAVPQNHEMPAHTDRTREGYYSVFQIDHLHLVLTQLTLHVRLDSFLDRDEDSSADWREAGDRWMQSAESCAASLRDHQYRRAVALLCQHISDRYFPQTQTDMRTMQIRSGHSSDAWIIIDAHDWNWEREARLWDSRTTEELYGLTPEKLRHAYRGLAMDQAGCDPIRYWYQLTQFVSVHERRKLKGDALRAETMRTGAHMLRLLHRDLYGEDLPHPNEVAGSIIEHVPELDARRDVRRHLELVANRFGVNPQPKLSLILDGDIDLPADRRALQRPARRPRVDHIDLAPAGMDPHTEPGEVAVVEHPVAPFDRERLDHAPAQLESALSRHAPLSHPPVTERTAARIPPLPSGRWEFREHPDTKQCAMPVYESPSVTQMQALSRLSKTP